MSIDLYAESPAMELSAEGQSTALKMLPTPTLSLQAGGYSLAGDSPGPRDFPEIEPPSHGEE